MPLESNSRLKASTEGYGDREERGRRERGREEGDKGWRVASSYIYTAGAGTATNISRYSRGIEPRAGCAFTAGSREICSFPSPTIWSHRRDSIVVLNARHTADGSRIYRRTVTNQPTGYPRLLSSPRASPPPPPTASTASSSFRHYIYIQGTDPSIAFSESVLSRRYSSFHVSVRCTVAASLLFFVF